METHQITIKNYSDPKNPTTVTFLTELGYNQNTGTQRITVRLSSNYFVDFIEVVHSLVRSSYIVKDSGEDRIYGTISDALDHIARRVIKNGVVELYA